MRVLIFANIVGTLCWAEKFFKSPVKSYWMRAFYYSYKYIQLFDRQREFMTSNWTHLIWYLYTDLQGIHTFFSFPNKVLEYDIIQFLIPHRSFVLLLANTFLDAMAPTIYAYSFVQLIVKSITRIMDNFLIMSFITV